MWSDEFNGTSLDTSRWSNRQSGPRWDGTLTADAVSVGGGALTIKTYTENGTHYSGMIATQTLAGIGGFEQTYGHFEARLRFNSSPGQWSAFWLQSPTMGATIGDPGSSGVEMDVAEHRTRCVTPPPPLPAQTCAGDISDRIQSALLWDGYGADAKVAAQLSAPLAGLDNGSWHTYALRWTPTDIVFLYDDVPIWSQSGPISRRSEYIILSSEVGAFFAGPIPAGGYGSKTTSTTSMQVDWVRVWQTTAPMSTAAPTLTGTPEVGRTLACAKGTWSGEPAPTFTYAWLADGSPIAGATASTYVLQASDGDHAVACRVTATNSAGAASATSAPLTIAAAAVVQPPPPAPPPPPPPAPAPIPPPPVASFTFAAVPPPPPPLPDTAPPTASLSGSGSQRIASTVAVTISCTDEPCLATASGTLSVPRVRGARALTYRPAARTAFIAEGANVAVRLRLSRAVRVAISRALRAHARSVLRLRVRVADNVGNARTLTREMSFRR
ncbi:MAG: hypothetical protein QOJ89_2013 [bacterium]